MGSDGSCITNHTSLRGYPIQPKLSRWFCKWLPLVCSILLFANEPNWQAITSLINPTDVTFINDSMVYASTNGGILSLNLNQRALDEIGFEQGLKPLDFASIYSDDDGWLWLGGNEPHGGLQVLDMQSREIQKITHLDFINKITRIIRYENKAFAIGHSDISDGLLEFSIENGQVYYKDIHDSFPFQVSIIYDIDIEYKSELVEWVIYLCTDGGLLYAPLNEISSYSSGTWQVANNNEPIYQMAGNYYFTNMDIINLDGSLFYDGINGIPQDSKYDQNTSTIHWIDNEGFYEIDNNGNTWEYKNTYNPEQDSVYIAFTSFDIFGDHVILSIENHGLTLISEKSHISTHIPNSIIINNTSAISVTNEWELIGVGLEGGFYEKDGGFTNFYSYVYGYNFPSWGDGYNANKFSYHRGYHFPRSIVQSVRGTYLFNNYGIELDKQNKYGGIVEFDPYNNEIIIYDKTNNVLDGTAGIIEPCEDCWYSHIPILKKDKMGNIWAVNALAEHTNQLTAIQLPDGSWTHAVAPDESSYFPHTVDFGPNGWAWFGFLRHDVPLNYSSGGIKVLNTKNTLNDSSDDIWLELTHPDTLPGGANQNVYSLAFGKTGTQDILWVLGNTGVQGYLVSGMNLTAIYPIEFYGNLPYTKGDRIRIDAQNNVWVITQHDGVRVIQADTTPWPDAAGFTAENSGLLSNIVYDVAFDENQGIAYLATDQGISVLEIPFAKEQKISNNEILLSPNPFWLPSEKGLSIFAIPNGSVVRVMTLNGLVVKTFHLNNNENVINNWDGRQDNGHILSSGIYLVSAQHPDDGNFAGKLAVIRR